MVRIDFAQVANGRNLSRAFTYTIKVSASTAVRRVNGPCLRLEEDNVPSVMV